MKFSEGKFGGKLGHNGTGIRISGISARPGGGGGNGATGISMIEEATDQKVGRRAVTNESGKEIGVEQVVNKSSTKGERAARGERKGKRRAG